MDDTGQRKAPSSSPHDGNQGKAQTEGLITDTHNDKSLPNELQPQTPLETVLRLLDCVNADYCDHREKRAQIRLVSDYIQTFLDDRPYAPSEQPLDDFPF